MKQTKSFPRVLGQLRGCLHGRVKILVSFDSQPFLGSSRNGPVGGALRDEPKNGCEGD